jgi:hypothetical protein
MNESYKNKYLKYKSKYLKLKNQLGGADPAQPVTLNHENKNYECKQLSDRQKYEENTEDYKKLEGEKTNNTIKITGDYDPEAKYNKYYNCIQAAAKSQTQSRKINPVGLRRLNNYLDPNYKQYTPYFQKGDRFFRVAGLDGIGKPGRVLKLDTKNSGRDSDFYYDVKYDDGSSNTFEPESSMIHERETTLE